MKAFLLPELQSFCDNVTAGSQDGAYTNRLVDRVQIVIVGPMRFTPGEYVAAANLAYHDEFEIESAEFLPGGDDDARKTVLLRGFVSLILKSMPP